MSPAFWAALQFLALLTVLGVAHYLAVRSHRRVLAMDAEQHKRRRQEQENAAGIMLFCIRNALADAEVAVRQKHMAQLVRTREALDVLIDHAKHLGFDAIPVDATWHFLDGLRIAADCNGEIKSFMERAGGDSPHTLESADSALAAVLNRYQEGIHRRLARGV